MKAKLLGLLPLLFVGGCGSQAGDSASSPLTCSTTGADALHAPIVTCTVRDNNLSITNVTVNRGNCQSPVLSADQLAFFWSNVDQENANESILTAIQKLLQGYDPGYIARYYATTATLLGTPTWSAPKQSDQLLFWAFVQNPSHVWMRNGQPIPYKFGDTVAFAVAGCPNMIEYTIETNEGGWTWEVNN